MPKDKSEKQTDQPKRKRGRPRKKPLTVADVPQIIVELPDERMQKAAMALATCGYRKGSKRRNGAVIHAARTAGVSRETIYNWLEEPLFEDAIQEVNSILVQECFAGLRLCVLKADAKGIVEFLGRLDPELDLAWQRHKSDQEHEERMLRLKIELAKLEPEGDDSLPQIIIRETAQGERIATPKDEDLN